MSERVSLVGHPPVVEYRSSLGRYFVTYPTLELELVMSFESKFTAREIAVHTFCGTPFFQMIPTVPYGQTYPRPGLIYPKVQDPGVSLKVLP